MLLIKNNQGQLVEKLQQKLSELGYNVGPVDGVFGPRTESAVIKFQTDRGLDIDGVVGPQVWKELFEEPVPEKPGLENPPSQDRCFEVYGDFRLAGWDQQSIVRCDLAEFSKELEHIYWDWMTEKDKAFIHTDWFGFQCHKLVAPKFREAFKNVVDRELANQIKTFGGCLNKRLMRGGSSWSMHSWGIAIDINPSWNRFGQKKFEMNEGLVKCFEDVGLVWGGRWMGCPDAMHFQYATIR